MRWLCFLLSILLYSGVAAAENASELQSPEQQPVVRIATFDVDATPPIGSAMAYDPVRKLDEMTLRCRGVVLLGAQQPIVLCSVDWIGIANGAHDAFRDALAAAADTSRDRVAVHVIHQHDAPGYDLTAEQIVGELGIAGYEVVDSQFPQTVVERAAAAIEAALPKARPATHYGWGAADVQQVASNRRIMGPDGKVRAVRYTTARDPALRAEPEGIIDRQVSVLSFYDKDQPLAILSYYACHPQSYYLTGIPSPDFPGIARFMRGQSVPEALHVHFNGAGGNIGAGKYNDGAKANRVLLASRLAAGMRAAYEATEKVPLGVHDVDWQVAPVGLPPAKHLVWDQLVETARTAPRRTRLGAAVRLGWLKRSQDGHKIDIACLQVGNARVLHMPGELFVEYQLAAKAMRPDLFVAMAAYGDYGPGYIGTSAAYAEGGYETEPRSSGVAPHVETVLTTAMSQLLRPGDAVAP